MMNDEPDASNEGVRVWEQFDNLEKLQEHVNGKPFDWASKPMGLRFENMSEEDYNLMKEALDEGNLAFFVACDWNVTEIFMDRCRFKNTEVDL